MSAPVLSPLVDSLATLIDVEQVATLLGVSARTVRRMADSGAMPRPRRLNTLIRWSRLEIEAWVKAGCPSCRPSKARAT
ncbi:MAG: helix-turn-helix domain-containing protein [Planctomycetales bacterium]|nr:helix-turn-helix domain-containing protein [Planctomycetales bacterium]